MCWEAGWRGRWREGNEDGDGEGVVRNLKKKSKMNGFVEKKILVVEKIKFES